jgi:hypothetical protein
MVDVENGVGQLNVTGAIPNKPYQVQTTFSIAEGKWANWSYPFLTLKADFAKAIPISAERTQFFRLMQVSEQIGSLSVSGDSTSPPSALATAGSVNVVIGVWKFRPTGENFFITNLGLKSRFPNPGLDIFKVTVWDGATQVGFGVFTGNNMTAVCYCPNPIATTQDNDKTIVIKADFNQIGIGQPGKSGDQIAIDFDPAGTVATGVSSGQNVIVSGETHSAPIILFKSIPIVRLETVPVNGLLDGRFMRFSVSADFNGPVNLGKLTFTVKCTGATFSKLSLTGYTDAGFSQPISSGVNGNLGELTLPQTASATAVIFPQSPVTIPAGQKLYFELRSNLIGIAANFSVNTVLVGDGTGPLMGTFGEVNRLWPANFVWSPNSVTSSSTFVDKDWVNGYLIPGLPSTGLMQSRVN